ncbi:tetratricopeptide repeat protein, partial [Pseudomonas aeruginosa]
QALSGVIARGRGDIDKAEAHCREALQDLAGERYGTRLQCLSTLSNLAVTRGDFWQARNYNRDALEFAQRYGNPLFEALVHYDGSAPGSPPPPAGRPSAPAPPP